MTAQTIANLELLIASAQRARNYYQRTNATHLPVHIEADLVRAGMAVFDGMATEAALLRDYADVLAEDEAEVEREAFEEAADDEAMRGAYQDRSL